METPKKKTGDLKFGKRLKSLRERRGMTQDELGKCAGLTADRKGAAISAAEHGHSGFKMATLRKIADCLGVSMSELMGQDSLPEPHAPLHHDAFRDILALFFLYVKAREIKPPSSRSAEIVVDAYTKCVQPDGSFSEDEIIGLFKAAFESQQA